MPSECKKWAFKHTGNSGILLQKILKAHAKINARNTMKRILLFSIFLAAFSLSMNAEKTWAQYERYAASNDTLIARRRMPEYGYNKLANSRRIEAVLMGNSITDNWAKFDPEFFIKNKFVGRGISGQTSAQMLSRFQADVIALNPKMVIILAGANDIAQNNGYISLEHIMQNIQSMCELAKFHKIKPVLCSCLPAAAFKWRPELKPAEEIKRLNEMIKAYAKANHITYVDYHSALVDDQGGLPKKYANDGVHPNIEGYKIMEQILLKSL